MKVKKKILKLVLIFVFSLSFDTKLSAYEFYINCKSENCGDTKVIKNFLVDSFNLTNNSKSKIDLIIYKTMDFFNLSSNYKINKNKVIIDVFKYNKISDINIKGNKSFSDEVIKDILNIDFEYVYYERVKDKIINDIKNFYSDKGFLYTKIKIYLKDTRLFIEILEGIEIIVSKIDLDIVGKVSKNKIFNILNIKVGDRISKFLFNEKIKKLEKYFYDNRYYSREFVETSLSINDEKAYINIKINTGPRVRFKIEGLSIFNTYDELLEVLNVNKESSLNLNYFDNLESNLVNKYKSLGYKDVKVKTFSSVTYGLNFLDISFLINNTKKYFVNDLIFKSDDEKLNKKIKNYIYDNFSMYIDYYYEDKILELRNIVKNYLEELGYLNAKVYPLKFNKKDDNSYDVVFEIEQFYKAKIRNINIQGVESIEQAKFDKIFDVKSKDDFNVNKINNFLVNLNNLYLENGYNDVLINKDKIINISKNFRFVDLNVNVIEGKKYSFGNVYIFGNEKTKNKVIYRELLFKPNDVYDVFKLSKSEKKLSLLGVFRQIKIITFDRSKNIKDVIIKVKEKKQGLYEVGLGFKTDDGFNLSSSISYNNINGLNSRLSLNASINSNITDENYNFLEYSVGIAYFLPYVLDSTFDLRLVAKTEKEDLIFYGQESSDFSVYVEKKFNKHKIILKNAIENINFIKIQDDFSTDPNYWKYSIKQSYYYDSRNTIFNPEKGFYYYIFSEFGHSFSVDQSNDYVKIVNRIRNYYKLYKTLVFYSSLHLGSIFGINNSTLLLDERFLLGGTDSIRGYKLRIINKYDELINQQFFYTANFELRQDLFYNLIGVAFLDFGDLQNKVSSFIQPYTSTGLGIRLDFDVAYLSFEYAFIINTDRLINPDQKGRFHISIGAY